MTRQVAIDFFCGAGGMTNGLIRAGFHVLAGVDNEPLCERTFRQNKNKDGSRPEYLCMDVFPRSRAHPDGQQSALTARIRELILQHKRTHRHRALRLVFAICAPCQPFTKITKIEMSEGRQFKRTNDSNLLLTTINLIKEFRPDAIICENVEGIVSGPTAVLQSFKRRLGRIGYSFDAKIVNASRFGVPQNRRRTIGIGFDTSKRKLDFEVPEADPSVRKKVTVGQAIGKYPPLAPGEIHPTLANHRVRSLSEINLKRISCAPPGATNGYLKSTPYGDLSLRCHRDLESKTGAPSFGDTYTRMSADDVAPTITTKSMSISNGRFGHFDVAQNRSISPREAATLQTFPAGYVFYPEENIEFTCTLIGNAVPPRLARYLGKFVIQRIPA